MTEGQRQNMEQYWDRYGVEVDGETLLNPAELFPTSGPLWLEVGFGNGEALAHIGANNPAINILGIEVHLPGVGHALGEIADRELSNVRVIRYDALEVLANCLPAGCVERFLLLFPDPWRKTRHQKRRIVNPEFIALVHRVLQPGGIIHFATDWEPYAHWIKLQMGAQHQLTQVVDADIIETIISVRPPTKFEQRGLKLGHSVTELVYKKAS